MTDQTRWGIDQVQVKNKAIKYQKDLVASAMAHVVKMDESGIADLMLQIEAEYERKYGDNVAKKYTKTVLQYSVTDFIFFLFFSLDNVYQVYFWSRSVGIYDFRVDTFWYTFYFIQR